MPGYTPAALHKYRHPAPTTPQHASHTWNKPTYGATQQLTLPDDTTDLASEPDKKRIQQVTGTLLFYACAVDPTMLMTISTIAAQQSKATQLTIKATNQRLDYCHTHPNAIIEYRASAMQLKIHSNASYLAEPKGCSRGGGHYYSGDKPSTTPEAAQAPLLNRSNVIKNVMGSAAEAEVGSLYDSLREGVPLRNTLQEMGYPQPPTPVQVDNYTTNGSTKIKSNANAIDHRPYQPGRLLHKTSLPSLPPTNQINVRTYLEPPITSSARVC
jgi:hypothetical protein